MSKSTLASQPGWPVLSDAIVSARFYLWKVEQSQDSWVAAGPRPGDAKDCEESASEHFGGIGGLGVLEIWQVDEEDIQSSSWEVSD